MEMTLQKVARLLSHTHTFCTILVMLVMLVSTGVGKAQGGGQFLFSALTSPDPSTGMQRCTVSWTPHEATIVTINANISFSAYPICIDIPATEESVPDELSDFINVTSTEINIKKASNTPLNILPNYPIFMVIYISGEPSESVTFTGSGFLTNTNNVSFPILPSPQTRTFAPGFSIFGITQKLGGTPCNGGSNNGIPGVQLTISRVNTPGEPSCYAGPTMPANTVPFVNDYSFDNLPANFTYKVAAAKFSGCDCGPNGPITVADYKLARNYVVGVEGPLPLLWAHAGDYSGNGILDATDLVLITKCHLGEPQPLQPSLWHFAAIDNASNFANPILQFVNPLPPLPPPSLDVPNLAGNSRVDFIGIKRGDVDHSCSLCGGNLTGGSSEARNEEKKTFRRISIPATSLEPGEEALIPVLATDDLNGLAVLGMEWTSGNKIEFIEVQDMLQADEYSAYRVRNENNRQMLNYDWFTMTNGGKKVGKGDALFYMRIKALDKIQDLRDELLLFSFSPNNTLYYDNGLSEAHWQLSKTDRESAEHLSAYLIGGNQLNTSTAQVEVYLPQSGPYQIVVSDMSGNIANAQSFDAQEKGKVLKEVNIPDNAGIYQVTISTSSERHMIRLIKY